MNKIQQEILDLDHKVKNLLNFKRKWLDDKSGYWWEKRFNCKFFTVKFDYSTDTKWLVIELLSGKDSFGYEKYLQIYSKKNVTFEKLKELHSYWKKQSNLDKSKNNQRQHKLVRK